MPALGVSWGLQRAAAVQACLPPEPFPLPRHPLALGAGWDLVSWPFFWMSRLWLLEEVPGFLLPVSDVAYCSCFPGLFPGVLKPPLPEAGLLLVPPWAPQSWEALVVLSSSESPPPGATPLPLRQGG